MGLDTSKQQVVPSSRDPPATHSQRLSMVRYTINTCHQDLNPVLPSASQLVVDDEDDDDDDYDDDDDDE